MTFTELTPNTITRTAIAAVEGQPLHMAYAAVGLPTCPACGSTLNAIGWAEWPDEVRTQWRCVNRSCVALGDMFSRVTYKVGEPLPPPPPGRFLSRYIVCDYCPAPATLEIVYAAMMNRPDARPMGFACATHEKDALAAAEQHFASAS